MEKGMKFDPIRDYKEVSEMLAREEMKTRCGFIRCEDADGKVAHIKAEKIAAVYDEADGNGEVCTVVLISDGGRFEEILVEEKPDEVMEEIREVMG